MKKTSPQLVIALLMVAAVCFIIATPLSDWLSDKVEKQDPVPPPEMVKPSAKSPFPVLRLKREALKPPESTEGPDELTLPAPRPHGPTKTLANDEIEQTIIQRQSLFQRCWTQRLRDNPNLAGNVLLQFVITPRGKVQEAQIAEATIKDETMLQCLLSVLERITFREFTGTSITLTFPLSFE